MDDFELYLKYLRHCESLNFKLGLDPVHDEMEWNHTLPKKLFGDQPFGQFLTKKQHAIVTALQTLVFDRNLVCAWHIDLIPKFLWEKCSSYYSEMCRKNGEEHGLVTRGFTFATSGAHDSQRQSVRGKGKKRWWNPTLKKGTLAFECPGEDWQLGISPDRDMRTCLNKKWYHNPETGETTLASQHPGEGWKSNRK